MTSFKNLAALTSIADDAFKNCKALGAIEIPSKVTSIGREAFHNCVSLKTAKVYPSEPPATYVSIFEYVSTGITGLRIMVPAESLNKNKSATGWSYYSTAIYALEE